MPELEIASDENVRVSAWNGVEGLMPLITLGKARYEVRYTPIISGHYAVAILIGGAPIWSDLSAGVAVHPSSASALQSTHDSNWFATEGELESFVIQATDRFVTFRR